MTSRSFNPDGSLAVTVDGAHGNRETCFHFEDASYVAVDGFELVGGVYGVCATGCGFAASEHSRGIAVNRRRTLTPRIASGRNVTWRVQLHSVD